MTFKLTEKGAKEVARIKAQYENLLPRYGRNSMERALYLNRKLPSFVTLFALSAYPMSNANEMIKYGYATGVRY